MRAVAVALMIAVGASQDVVLPATSQATRSVALTFDDLPATQGDLAAMQETTARLLRTLVVDRVPAIGFVKEINLFQDDRVEARTALLDAWLNAGFELGNHTYSHVSIDRVSFDTYAEDVIKG